MPFAIEAQREGRASTDRRFIRLRYCRDSLIDAPCELLDLTQHLGHCVIVEPFSFGLCRGLRCGDRCRRRRPIWKDCFGRRLYGVAIAPVIPAEIIGLCAMGGRHEPRGVLTAHGGLCPSLASEQSRRKRSKGVTVAHVPAQDPATRRPKPPTGRMAPAETGWPAAGTENTVRRKFLSRRSAI